MKDFHVAPVEPPDDIEEGGEPNPNMGESPLERFRRVSKLVASQSANIKWNEVIRCATIEAHSQIGRCRNRESFKNQQTLMKAMEQARRLIEQSPSSPSPNHSTYSYNIDQTNQTLVQLLKNISEEINEISPQNTLRVNASKNRSVTPLNALNAQLQTLISKSPSHYATKIKPKSQESPPRDGVLSPPPKPSPQTPSLSSTRSETPKSPVANPTSIFKSRTPTPDSCRSFDDIPIIAVEEVAEEVKPSTFTKPESPKLIDLKENTFDEAIDEKYPLKQGSGSPIKVFKRKAPKPEAIQDIAVSRPAVVRIQSSQGMIPPPPARDESKPVPIPILSTTPATPLFPQKPLFFTSVAKSEASGPNEKEIKEPDRVEEVTIKIESSVEEKPKPPIEMKTAPPVEARVEVKIENPVELTVDHQTPAMIATSSSPVTHSSTELLIPDPKQPPSSPACLRVGKKVEDVKTIKRQARAGWL